MCDPSVRTLHAEKEQSNTFLETAASSTGAKRLQVEGEPSGDEGQQPPPSAQGTVCHGKRGTWPFTALMGVPRTRAS